MHLLSGTGEHFHSNTCGKQYKNITLCLKLHIPDNVNFIANTYMCILSGIRIEVHPCEHVQQWSMCLVAIQNIIFRFFEERV